MSNVADSSDTKETEENTNNTNKKVAKHKSGFKSGRFSRFTDVFGVFVAFGGRSKGSCNSRHDSLQEADKAANATYESYSKPESSGNESIFEDSPFHGFVILGYGSNTVSISVEEVEIDKCKTSELKTLAKKYDIQLNKAKRKADILKLVKPIIQHKIHLNRYEEVDYLKCSFCQTNNKDEYEKFMEKRNKNPTIAKFNALNKMYNKSLSDPIKERDVKSTYGLTDDELEAAVMAQKIHWNKRSCFGNAYRLYERSEIIAYCKNKKQEEKEKENQQQQKQKSKKRKQTEDDDDDEVEEPSAKKRKLTAL